MKCKSKSVETDAFVHSVDVGVATVLCDLWRVLKVEPRAFRSQVHATVGVCGPAVEATIPVVVRVLVGHVLDSEHTFFVKPVLPLEDRRVVTGDHIVAHNMEEGITGNENLLKWSIEWIHLRKPRREEWWHFVLSFVWPPWSVWSSSWKHEIPKVGWNGVYSLEEVCGHGLHPWGRFACLTLLFFVYLIIKVQY